MNYLKKIGGGLCLAFIITGAMAQTQKLRSLLTALNNGYDAMGSMTITKNNATIFQKATGYQNESNGHSLPATPATRYRIGSISKIFTAVMILQLMEEKKLTLETPLATYYPAMPNSKLITIGNLLNHRSGLSDIKDIPGFAVWCQQPHTKAEVLAEIEKSTVHFDPGKKAEYNNSGYILLGYIIEDIEKKSYATELQERIIDKLGLKDTYYKLQIQRGPVESSSFVFNNGWQKSSITDPSVPAGAGAIVATTGDLARFITALFQGKLISKTSLEKMEQIRDDFGYGMMRFRYGEQAAYGHDGQIDGYLSAVRYFPQSGIAIAYCANALYYPLKDIITAAAGTIFYQAYQIQKPDEYYKRSPKNDFLDLKNADSIFFDAIFQTKNYQRVAGMLSQGFTFYQDQGYTRPTTSQNRAKYLEGIAALCDPKSQNPPMRREVVKGSMQVFITGPAEAVQTGVQHFYVLAKGAPDQLVEESKFSRTWRQVNGRWKMALELDYLYNSHLNDPPSAQATPPAKSLRREIGHMDSLLFNAFNNKDIAGTKKLYAPDSKFFDDATGVTGYESTMSNFQTIYEKNKNNGLRRELLPGTMQIYPIKGFGAIEIGEHRFCHSENGQPDCGTFKFAIVWRKTGNDWKALRLISYGHLDQLKPTDSTYQGVAGMDKQLFDAFNHQQGARMGDIFSKELEFYQDNEGLENYQQTMQDFEKMFSVFKGQKLRRDLVPGTMVIYPIDNYGALQIGDHRFSHTESGQQLTGIFKFFNLWELKDSKWKLAMTISYGH